MEQLLELPWQSTGKGFIREVGEKTHSNCFAGGPKDTPFTKIIRNKLF